MHRFDRQVVLSGCSGGGKSTLLAELAARGFATVPEPGRRIIAHARDERDAVLPWIDLAAFARAAITMSRADRLGTAESRDWVFFDRGLIDATAALAFATGADLAALIWSEPRFHARVFLTPPWPDLFAQDDVRRHGWSDAVAEYDRLCAAYIDLGYEAIVLPKTSVARRADFILNCLRQSSRRSQPSRG